MPLSFPNSLHIARKDICTLDFPNFFYTPFSHLYQMPSSLFQSKQGMQFSSAYLSIKFVMYFLFSKLPVHLLGAIKKIYHVFALFQTSFRFVKFSSSDSFYVNEHSKLWLCSIYLFSKPLSQHNLKDSKLNLLLKSTWAFHHGKSRLKRGL